MKNNNMGSGFLKKANNRFFLAAFLLLKVPAAYFTGLKLVHADENCAEVKVRYRWITQNPFNSIYFAVLAMAAELCSGILSMNAVEGAVPRVSMLVLAMNADFRKKAVGKITFRCTDGEKIRNAVALAVKSGRGVSAETVSTGTDEHGDVVAEFRLTWTFKQKISL